MLKNNVKNLLLITSCGKNAIYPFLFQFAKCWAKQGRPLLYISKVPLENLPPSIGKVIHLQVHDLKLMQFMYLPKWMDLLTQLATIRNRRFRVNAIILDNLADYFENLHEKDNFEVCISHICATLLHSISVLAEDCTYPVVLICGYINKNSNIEKAIIKNFFHNIWKVETTLNVNINKMECKLSNMFPSNCNKVITSLSFTDNYDFINDKDRSKAKLELAEIIETLVQE